MDGAMANDKWRKSGNRKKFYPENTKKNVLFRVFVLSGFRDSFFDIK
jgi:hypothetical protein